VRDIGRSGVFLNAVSNRLAAASTKARFLGMIVGTAISQLIEQPGKAMRFDLEEMDSDEAQWYLSLVKTKDDFGSLDAVKPQKDETRKTQKVDAPSATSVARTQPPTSQQSKIVSIEEVDDSGDEEDHAEEIPYENPDIDASDSDDDPTLVKRKKPTPPV
jgi:telomere length regulation protein